METADINGNSNSEKFLQVVGEKFHNALLLSAISNSENCEDILNHIAFIENR